MSKGRMVVLGLALFAIPEAVLADARTIGWEEFLRPVRAICAVKVVAAEELGARDPQPAVRADGMIPIGSPPMTSVARTTRSLAGRCPSVIELHWQRPNSMPVFVLPLNEVGSHFVLFLGEPIDEDPQVRRFSISPHYAWQQQIGRSDDLASLIAYYQPQAVLVPRSLWSARRLRFDFPGGHVETVIELIEENDLFEVLRTLPSFDGGDTP